jgi:hypothetical protein
MNHQEGPSPAVFRLDSDRKSGNSLASVSPARNQAPVQGFPKTVARVYASGVIALRGTGTRKSLSGEGKDSTR